MGITLFFQIFSFDIPPVRITRSKSRHSNFELECLNEPNTSNESKIST